jgi:hypothetical protein
MRALRWLDPYENAGAQADTEPVTFAQLLALTLASGTAAFFFLRWKFQPMQDFGHHLAIAAIASDWGREGSLYTALYTPVERLAANSLLYTLSGLLGRVIGVTLAVRLWMLVYVAGLPWVVAWALRIRGRSIWPAVAAAGLLHYGIFVAGFANHLFAAPFLIVAVVLFARLLESPAPRRALFCAVAFALVFLAHVHAFLWLGALCAALLVRALWLSLRRPDQPPFARQLGFAAASAIPALLLFGRWYVRTFVRGAGGAFVSTTSLSHGFGATYKTAGELVRDLPGSLQSLRSGADLALLGLLLLLCAFALGARQLAPPRERVLELCAALTFAAYFVLPENLSGHEDLGSRQPSMALWFLPVLLAPVPASASRFARSVVVIGTLVWTAAFLGVWGTALWHFEREEAAGLAEVLDAAPPRARLHMVKLDPDSRYFTWRSLWHVEKYVMSDKLGQTPDTSGINATAATHYLPGIDIHRVTWHTPDWPSIEEIWANFDVVLVRRWHPSPAQRARAESRGHLLKRSGDWELWSTHR